MDDLDGAEADKVKDTGHPDNKLLRSSSMEMLSSSGAMATGPIPQSSLGEWCACLWL